VLHFEPISTKITQKLSKLCFLFNLEGILNF
jgi:hypothetical protein